MSGVWKRSHGRATKAPPDESGGKPICSTYSHRTTSRLYRFAPFNSLRRILLRVELTRSKRLVTAHTLSGHCGSRPWTAQLGDFVSSYRSKNKISSSKAAVQTTRRNAMHLAVTPWLNRRLPSAGPKSDGLFSKLSLLFSCLRRSDASRTPSSGVYAAQPHTSRAPSSGVCAAQPHTHQRILLQPRIRHSLVPFEHSVELRVASQANHPSIVSVWLGQPSASAQ